jgi:hypothetical protein
MDLMDLTTEIEDALEASNAEPAQVAIGGAKAAREALERASAQLLQAATNLETYECTL